MYDRVSGGRHSRRPATAGPGKPGVVYRAGQWPLPPIGDQSSGEPGGRTYPGSVMSGEVFGGQASEPRVPSWTERWQPSVGALADELYLLIHEGWNARPLLPRWVAGRVVAASLLGELALMDRVEIDDDGVLVVVNEQAPADLLAHQVLDELVRAQGHVADRHRPVREWLEFLGTFAYDAVAQRMVRQGLLEARERRLLWRRSVSYEPLDRAKAGVPLARLSSWVWRRHDISSHDAFLMGLLAAVDLDRLLVERSGGEGREHVTAAINGLRPPMSGLLRHSRAAIGDANLAGR